MENQQRMNNIRQQGPEAVDFAKQTKGYTDAGGRFIPPTMPSEISSPYGSGSVGSPDMLTRGTMKDHMGRTVFTDEYLPEQSIVQDTKYGAMPGQEDGGALTKPRVTPRPSNLSGIDQIFPGQSSPPGDGAGSGLVGAGSALGAPGGGPEVVQQPNSFLQGVPESNPFEGMPMPQGSASNPYTSDPFSQFGESQFNQQQTDALEKLRGLSNFSARVGDFWPGNDYDYLQQLFPQVDPRKFPTTNSLLDAYRNLGR